MGQAKGEQERHDRDDQQQIGEPGRVRRDERRHGLSIRNIASATSARRWARAIASRSYRSNAITSFILNPVQHANDDEQHHDGEDDRHVDEPRRIRGNERRIVRFFRSA